MGLENKVALVASIERRNPGVGRCYIQPKRPRNAYGGIRKAEEMASNLRGGALKSPIRIGPYGDSSQPMLPGN